MASFQRKRKLEDERNDIINRNLDKAIENGKMIREKDKKEAKRLKEMGEQLRKGLSKKTSKRFSMTTLNTLRTLNLEKKTVGDLPNLRTLQRSRSSFSDKLVNPFLKNSKKLFMIKLRNCF